MSEWTLLLDYGTCVSAAAILSAGHVDLVEVSGSPTTPSGMFRDPNGKVTVGLTAQRQARLSPERYVRTPLLSSISAADRVAAIAEVVSLLSREATLRTRRPPSEVRVTFRPLVTDSQIMRDGVSSAGFTSVPVVIVDPLVATSLEVSHPGSVVAVCDLGGAGFSCAVLAGSTVLASGFVPGVGGEAIDALLFREVVAAEVGRQLLAPPNATWRRAAEDLHRETRRAKEELSSSPGAMIDTTTVSGKRLEVRRSQLEGLLRAPVRACVAELVAVLARAGVEPGELAGVHLTGGGARIPALGRAVAEELGLRPMVVPSPRATLLSGMARITAPAEDTDVTLPPPSASPEPPPTPDPRASAAPPTMPFARPAPRPVPAPGAEGRVPGAVAGVGGLPVGGMSPGPGTALGGGSLPGGGGVPRARTAPGARDAPVDMNVPVGAPGGLGVPEDVGVPGGGGVPGARTVAGAGGGSMPEEAMAVRGRGRRVRVPLLAGVAVLAVVASAFAVHALRDDDAPAGEPAAVMGLRADVRGISVDLTWTPFPGADSYRVYRDPRTAGQSARVVRSARLTDRPGDDAQHTYSVEALVGSAVAGRPAPPVKAMAKAPYRGAQRIASDWTRLIPEQPDQAGDQGQRCRPQIPATRYANGEIRCVFGNGVQVQVMSYASRADRDRRFEQLGAESGATDQPWRAKTSGRTWSGRLLRVDEPGERARGPWRFWTYEQRPTSALYAVWPRHTGQELRTWWKKRAPMR